MTPLSHYQALGRQLEQARSVGDSDEVIRLEAELRRAPPVIRYLYLGDAAPASLEATPTPPADQLDQLLAQVRAPAASREALPAKIGVLAARPLPAELGVRAAHPHEPRGAIAARPPDRAATAWHSAGAAGIRNVLVVDPDERILGSWKRAAREHDVITAAEAITGRQLASTQRPDLAIVELRLGNASGIDLIREIKRELPDLTAVLCSGYLSVATAVAAIRAGADIVLFKPITFREILERVREHIEEPDVEDSPTLARAEWEHIMRVLNDCNGNVSMAARRLVIYRSSLLRRFRKHGTAS
jgi:two-component system response regulator RegA